MSAVCPQVVLTLTRPPDSFEPTLRPTPSWRYAQPTLCSTLAKAAVAALLEHDVRILVTGTPSTISFPTRWRTKRSVLIGRLCRR